MLLGVKNRLSPLEILTRDQIEDVHQATLWLLEKTGVKVHSEQALELSMEHFN